MGNWHIPEIILYTTSSIPALEKVEFCSSTGCEYTSLGLLARDDNSYYLVDWKTDYYYSKAPNVSYYSPSG